MPASPLAIVALLAHVVHARVVIAATLPHGDFVYDPSLVHGANGSVQLHGNATNLAAAIAATRPELIFLSTPHGLEDSNDFVLYENSNVSGFAHLGQDLHNASFPGYDVPLAVRGSRNVSTALVAALGGHRRNVSGLLAFADGEPIALRWGEVIPLSFLSAYVNRSRAAVVTWSMPTRRYDRSGAPMTEELLALGAAVGEQLESMPQRVAVLISSDLAHTHLQSGPYGFSPSAQPFDEAIGEWAASLADEPLLGRARSLVSSALSCGYTGLVMLHGMLTRSTAFGRDRWRPMRAGPFALAHPTYYGMLVAGFEREPGGAGISRSAPS